MHKYDMTQISQNLNQIKEDEVYAMTAKKSHHLCLLIKMDGENSGGFNKFIQRETNDNKVIIICEHRN